MSFNPYPPANAESVVKAVQEALTGAVMGTGIHVVWAEYKPATLVVSLPDYTAFEVTVKQVSSS